MFAGSKQVRSFFGLLFTFDFDSVGTGSLNSGLSAARAVANVVYKSNRLRTQHKKIIDYIPISLLLSHCRRESTPRCSDIPTLMAGNMGGIKPPLINGSLG